MKLAIITNEYSKNGDTTNGKRVYLSIPHTGNDAYLITHDDLKAGDIESIQNLYQSDLIIFMGTAIYPENLYQLEKVKKLVDKKKTKIALWYFDACNPNCKFTYIKEKYQRIKSILPYLDYLFTTDHSYPWEKEFKNYYNLMQGIDESEFKREHDYLNHVKHWDVIFTGGFTGVHEYRKNNLDFIGKNFSWSIYGRSSPNKTYGEDFISNHHFSRTVYIPTSPPGLRDNYWSNRIYLAVATGIPCVVEHVPGIENHFKPGKEIMVTGNQGHLKETIQFLLNNPDKANMIGKAGRKRVLRDHTYAERIREMLGVVYEQ